MTRSGIYWGRVYHYRDGPTRHALDYRVPYFLFDVDTLKDLDVGSAWFGFNRKAWFSWHDRDFGDGSGAPYRQFIEATLLEHDIHEIPDTILAMTLPRTLGYSFNPLTVVHCLNRDNDLIATVYEVNNTANGRVHYVLASERVTCEKAMPVSPFFSDQGVYEFRAPVPHNTLLLNITYRDASGHVLRAGFSGRREPFSQAAVRRVVLNAPLIAIKVIAAIHLEALKLWLKGVQFIGLGPSSDTAHKSHSIKDTL